MIVAEASAFKLSSSLTLFPKLIILLTKVGLKFNIDKNVYKRQIKKDFNLPVITQTSSPSVPDVVLGTNFLKLHKTDNKK